MSGSGGELLFERRRPALTVRWRLGCNALRDALDLLEPKEARRAQLVATLTRLPTRAELARLPAGVAWLEVRADLVGDPDDETLATLAARFDGGLIYTLRSGAEGGSGPSDPSQRADRLKRAAARPAVFPFVDLEADRDLVPGLLEALPAERRILSWHGPATPLAELERRFAAMATTPARLYKLVTAADRPGEELAPLHLLGGLERPDVVAFATGASGAWTRLVAPRLGATVIYGALPGGEPGAPGQPAVDHLIDDYGLPELRPATALYGIVGRPVTHSLSPRLHNRAYRELGLPALYVPFEASSFGDFWLEVVESGRLDELGLPLRGLSVTAPYKRVALAVAGATSPRTSAVGAANTLVETDGVWEAESTDPEGVVVPLERLGVELVGAEAAVVGAGGAGRAAVVGLQEGGARVTLVNRGEERGLEAAEHLDVPFVRLDDFEPGRYAVVVHATSLGHSPDDPLPFETDALAAGAVLVDLVYGGGETPLVRAARAAGRRVVDGREALLFQALDQFRLMTGRELPEELARAALEPGPEFRPAS